MKLRVYNYNNYPLKTILINFKYLARNFDDLKNEILIYLENLSKNIIPKHHNVDDIFNKLTLEILNILYEILRFNLIEVKEQKSPNIKKVQKQKTSRLANSEVEGESKKNEIGNFIENIILYLSHILEYDETYDKTIKELKKSNFLSFLSYFYVILIFCKLEIITMSPTMKRGGFDFTDIRKTLRMTFFKEKQAPTQKKQFKKTNFTMRDTFEKSQNSIFIKMQSFGKIIEKYLNKNFFSQNFENQTTDMIKDIKLQICKIFEFMLNYRYDFYLNNALAYFNECFLDKNKDKLNEKKKEFNDSLAQMLPSEIYEINDKLNKKQENQVFYYKKNYMRSFDEILNKPFLESLMIAFYFNSNDDDLENSLVNLIVKYCNQKSTFRNFFLKLELLITNEDKTLYQSMHQIVKKLNDNFFKIQVFFIISNNSLYFL